MSPLLCDWLTRKCNVLRWNADELSKSPVGGGGSVPLSLSSIKWVKQLASLPRFKGCEPECTYIVCENAGGAKPWVTAVRQDRCSFPQILPGLNAFLSFSLMGFSAMPNRDLAKKTVLGCADTVANSQHYSKLSLFKCWYKSHWYETYLAPRLSKPFELGSRKTPTASRSWLSAEDFLNLVAAAASVLKEGGLLLTQWTTYCTNLTSVCLLCALGDGLHLLDQQVINSCRS